MTGISMMAACIIQLMSLLTYRASLHAIREESLHAPSGVNIPEGLNLNLS